MRRKRGLKHASEALDLVEVEWDDACANSGWDSGESCKEMKLIPIRSVGYLYSKTRKTVVLAGTVDESGYNSRRECIPRSEVKRIRVIRRAR